MTRAAAIIVGFRAQRFSRRSRILDPTASPPARRAVSRAAIAAIAAAASGNVLKAARLPPASASSPLRPVADAASQKKASRVVAPNASPIPPPIMAVRSARRTIASTMPLSSAPRRWRISIVSCRGQSCLCCENHRRGQRSGKHEDHEQGQSFDRKH